VKRIFLFLATLVLCCSSISKTESESSGVLKDDSAPLNDLFDTANAQDTSDSIVLSERCNWHFDYTLSQGNSGVVQGDQCGQFTTFLFQYTDSNDPTNNDIQMLKAGFGGFGQAGSCQAVVKVVDCDGVANGIYSYSQGTTDLQSFALELNTENCTDIGDNETVSGNLVELQGTLTVSGVSLDQDKASITLSVNANNEDGFRIQGEAFLENYSSNFNRFAVDFSFCDE
jgi:hypothetical protein